MPIEITRRGALVGGLMTTIGMPTLAAADQIVKVAIISRTFFYLPLWVATRQGFMKDEGLDVQISILDDSDKVNELLRTGQVQLTLRTAEAAMIDAYRGGTLRVIAGGIRRLPHFIITQPHIRTLEQLRGANFGILAEKEGTTYVVQDIAKAIGLTPADYKMTVVGGSPTRARLLKEGKIDAGLQPIPASYEAEAAGFNNLGSVIPFVPDWQFTSVNAEKTWAEQNREIVVRFLRGLQRGRDFIGISPQICAKIAADELRTDTALATRMLDDIEKMGLLDPQMAVNEPGLVRVFETLQKSGDIAADRKFDMRVFADLSYWQESRKAREPEYTSATPPRPLQSDEK
jgi:NitT/TauT family transport system substrate-binding protein